jgi:Ca2+-transporting ATPase
MEHGLSAAEAARRLAQFGPNELPNPERRNFLRIAYEISTQPMFALLLGAATIYAVLGDGVDAAVLSAFATLSVTIGIVQESRSEKVLESLRALASPRALVVRDGVHQRIPGREVVPGDTIILAEGDRVAADSTLLEVENLLVDESLLTGESAPVCKKLSLDRPSRRLPGGEDQPFVFAGTLVVRGSGIAQVDATGTRSEMGQIGQSLQAINFEQPRLQKQLRWLVRNFAIAGISVATMVVLLLGFSRGSWLDAALGGIAVGMSVLPEEIPLVLAVFMAMGAWRISRAGILTRRAAAIEALGAATVLCTDKTGTLTENRMRLALVATDAFRWHGAADSPPNARIEAVLLAAMAASSPIPTDPMDRAIHEAALAAQLALPDKLLHSYGLSPGLPATSNIWHGPVTVTAYAKGAPETIADLCRLSQAERTSVLQEVDQFSAQGMRLLAVASCDLILKDGECPQSQRDIPFRYLGLVGFADPLRCDVPRAVSECRNAGIRVIMITGDYPGTARAIAVQAGIDSERVLAGDDIAQMDEAALAEAVRSTCIFARIRPQQKLRLVEALKSQGEIVAMTGDGVNDAPAMKAAHIGISMSGRGTDVAREASALVLLNDDFASIVATIRLGRRIYDNLRKAIEYIVAVHIPIAGLAVLPLVMGLPLMLMPVHIALLEMVIDPACSIVFEAEQEERDVMNRPPRRPDTPVLPRASAIWAGVQGLAAFLIVALGLILGSEIHMEEVELRAMVFSILVLMNLALILVNRSFQSSPREALLRPNRMLGFLSAFVVLALFCALYWPPAQALFDFGPLHWDTLALCLASGVVLVGILEIGKARIGSELASIVPAKLI